MILMPRINQVRFFNLKVKNAKFHDLKLDFQSKNTYVLAGNYTGKSTMIGFILNTLSPYRNDFPRGDSVKKRYLEHYVAKDRPGGILIEWRKDILPDQSPKFLLLGQIVQIKSNTLQQFFFIKEYSNETVSIEQFPFTADNKYNTYKELRQLLRKEDFKIIEVKKEWIEELEKHYIDNKLVKRLLKMNDTENSLKEGITFTTKRGLINYIIEDIIPVPNHAEELVNGLKQEYNLLREIPKYQTIIAYLKSIKTKMSQNEGLYDEWVLLTQNLKELLDTWNTLSVNLTEYKFWLQKARETLQIENENKSQELSDIERKLKEIQKEHDIISFQFYRELYSRYETKYKGVLVIKASKILFQEFLHVYQHLRELETIAEQISDLELKQSEKLGPLQKELAKRKSLYKQILIQTYQYTLHQISVINGQLNELTEECDTLIGKQSILETEVKHQTEERKKLSDQVEKIETQLKSFQSQYPTIITLENLWKHVEYELEQVQQLRKVNEEEILNFEKQIINKEADIKVFQSKIENIKRKITEVQDKNDDVNTKWGNMTQLEGFILKFGAIKSKEPAYHLINKNQQQSLDTELEFDSSKITKQKSELELLETKISYYTEYKSFPTSKEINQIIESLNNEGIVTHRGWEYYTANKEVVSEKWIQEFPQLFEGIIVQGGKLTTVINKIKDLDLNSEFPVFITQATVFSQKPSISVLNQNFVCLHEAIKWKYDSSQKEVYFKALKTQLFNTNQSLKKLIAKVSKNKELRSEIQAFLQLADEYTYKEYQDIIIQEKRNFKKLNETLIRLNSELQNKRNNKQDKEHDQIHYLKQEKHWISQNEQKNKLQLISVKIPDYKQEISELTESIAEKKDSLRNISDELLPKTREKMESLQKNGNTLLKNEDRLSGEYKDVFSKQLPDKSKSLAPKQHLRDVRQSYIEFKELLETDTDIKELEEKISQKRVAYRQKDQFVEERCESGTITRAEVAIFWEKYKTHPYKIPQLFQKTADEIKNLTKKEVRFENRKKDTSKNIAKYEGKIPHKVAVGLKVLLKVLKTMKTDLFNDINHYQEKEEQLSNELQQLIEEEKKCETLENSLTRSIKTVISDAAVFTSHYTEIKGDYNPKIRKIRITDTSFELIEQQIKKMLKKEEDLSKTKTEVNNQSIHFKKAQGIFDESIQGLIQQSEENAFLKDYQLVNHLNQLQIGQIKTLRDECENEIIEREKELSERNQKLNIQVNLVLEELEKCFNRIYQFQNTKITVKDHLSCTGKRPIKINFTFEKQELSELMKSYLETALTSLNTEQEYPEAWCDYDSLIRSMINEFLAGKIREVYFLLPKGKTFQYSDFEHFLHMSGGQTATVAIVLYCYIAHFKIKYQRRMDYQDQELVEKIPLTIPFINDNPIGQANKEELVRLQLDVAKSLQVQLIYFTGIEEVQNIEEFETIIKVSQSADLSVFTHTEEESKIIKGPTFSHTPIREEISENKI